MTTMENLFPGMEAFMEGDVEVDVNVGTPAPEEVVEEAETAADEQAEVVEATDEAEDVAEQAEEMFARFDEVDRMISHVQTYGVDRSFLSLMNYNDRLSKTFGIQLPACESFDAVGSPRSAESIACLEGLKEVAGKVWEFIKKVCAKIASYVARFVEATRVRIGSIDGNIGRLRKALQNRVDKSADAVKDIKIEIVPVEDLKKHSDAAQAVVTDIDKKANSVKAVFDSALTGNINDKAIENLSKAAGEYKKADAPKASETDVKNAVSRAKAYLDYAAGVQKTMVDVSAEVAKLRATAEQGAKVAKAAQARNDAGADKAAKTVKQATSSFNKFTSIAVKHLGSMNSDAAKAVKAASQLIVRGTEKKK